MIEPHISDFPAVLHFLRLYWWETADLVYGEGGITAAIRQYVGDHETLSDREARLQHLAADLKRLESSGFAGEPDWTSEDYHRFWKHGDVSRVLTAADIAIMLRKVRT